MKLLIFVSFIYSGIATFPSILRLYILLTRGVPFLYHDFTLLSIKLSHISVLINLSGIQEIEELLYSLIYSIDSGFI